MAHKDINPPKEFQFWFDPTKPPTSLIGLEYHLIGIKEHSVTRAIFCVLVAERVRRLKAGEKKIVVDLLFKEAFQRLLSRTTLMCSGCNEELSWMDFLNSPFELTHDSDKCRDLRIRKNLVNRREELLQELKKVTAAAIKLLQNSENVAGMHPADENPQRDPALDHQREKLEKMIKKFDAAINMHIAGKYGICNDCGEEISPARLMVAPNTSQCVECKAEKEEQEKVPGKFGTRVSLGRLDLNRGETA